jgi:hypothetical protein
MLSLLQIPLHISSYFISCERLSAIVQEFWVKNRLFTKLTCHLFAQFAMIQPQSSTPPRASAYPVRRKEAARD